MTLLWDKLQQTFNLALSRTCSCVAWRFCNPQIRTLCRITSSEIWKVASSEKKVMDMKSRSAPRRSSIVLANSLVLCLSFDSRRCINYTLYACRLRRLWTIRCNDFGIWSSREALSNDFQGLRSYAAWTFVTISSGVLRPPPCFFNNFPVAKKCIAPFLYAFSSWSIMVKDSPKLPMSGSTSELSEELVT